MVKFGTKLKANRVIEWADKYVDYKALKKFIKQQHKKEIENNPIVGSAGFLTRNTSSSFSLNSNCTDLKSVALIESEGERTYLLEKTANQQFETLIQQELQKVEKFYAEKMEVCVARLQLLKDQITDQHGGIQRLQKAMQGLGTYESIKRALMVLYRDMNLLHNYTILNYTAFVKIFKKYDKVMKRSCSENMLAQLNAASFYAATDLLGQIDSIEELFGTAFCEGNRKLGDEAGHLWGTPCLGCMGLCSLEPLFFDTSKHCCQFDAS